MLVKAATGHFYASQKVGITSLWTYNSFLLWGGVGMADQMIPVYGRPVSIISFAT